MTEVPGLHDAKKVEKKRRPSWDDGISWEFLAGYVLGSFCTLLIMLVMLAPVHS